MIKRAIAENRRFYARKENQDDLSETEISFFNLSETNFYFTCTNPEKFKISEQDTLVINFSVRQNDKLLPCELKVRVLRTRISNGILFSPRHFLLASITCSGVYLPDILSKQTIFSS